jgi:proprotein convertase subtilisin/kexin type 5
VCLTCPLGTFRNLDATKETCPCSLGYYDDGTSLCKQCDRTCLGCATLATNCTSCEASNLRTRVLFTCLCNDGYFDDGTNSMCQLCDPNCLTCVGTAVNCTACWPNNNRVIDPTTRACVCAQFFFSIRAMYCDACDYTCSYCADEPTKCTACVTALTFRRDSSAESESCPCQNGYFDSGAMTCSKCDATCRTCVLTSSSCQSCEEISQHRQLTAYSTCVC